MIIRKYRLSDTKIIMKLFYDTVHEINICDYTQEQVNAWAPESMDYEVWQKRLQAKLPYIAENNGEIVGFGELEPDGHIDCFYCHSKYQRKGVGSKLLSYIENTAKFRGIKRLSCSSFRSGKAKTLNPYAGTVTADRSTQFKCMTAYIQKRVLLQSHFFKTRDLA